VCLFLFSEHISSLTICGSIIIDFGFAKYVPAPEKTFTLCGTPLYLAPEVILNRGHTTSADHWSLGVLIYEMLTAETPFYRSGMDQVELYRKIVKARYVCPWDMSDDIVNIIGGFLTRDPAQRLGSLKGGEDDVLKHEFFSNIDFNELRHKALSAPYLPKIRDPLDASNFDDWGSLDDKRKRSYPDLDPKQEAVFDDF
jgi:serine/threonine protein kinase